MNKWNYFIAVTIAILVKNNYKLLFSDWASKFDFLKVIQQIGVIQDEEGTSHFHPYTWNLTLRHESQWKRGSIPGSCWSPGTPCSSSSHPSLRSASEFTPAEFFPVPPLKHRYFWKILVFLNTTSLFLYFLSIIWIMSLHHYDLR